ncbi:MAG TPA: sigma-70 family RNA polymerase sigma factor [Thermoanaerobaculia bacterium]|nr:sigma-70 family RNA polymerase sigma factor [Thermoanaerobaculia bacterium]
MASAETRGRGLFNTTRWSLIFAAAGDASSGAEARADFCTTYWYPVYAFIRRRGYGHPEAEDLTQGFFGLLLEKNYLGAADRERGRFRSFLLTAVSHYLSHERERANTAKRGGGIRHVSVDANKDEERYTAELSGGETPEQLFERRWALTVLDSALSRLREEYETKGKRAEFDLFYPSLVGDLADVPREQLAERLGVSSGALRVTLHRFRKRFHAILREVVASTVDADAEVDDEIRHLMRAISS